MSSLAITGIGEAFSGKIEAPVLSGIDTVICADGIITAVGSSADLSSEIAAAAQRIDIKEATLAPGLIDSHCHVVLGDYTPRQKTVDFLASYVHGGITTAISPGELHAQGRPSSAIGVTALAIAALTCFENFRPGGITVHAGSVILEPTLTDAHFTQLEEAGVRLAKFGFGSYSDPLDGVAQVRAAQDHGIVVTCHSGGASIPGSSAISTEHLLTLRPDVCGHINGGPTSLSIEGVRRIINETEMILQLVQAGNLKSAIEIIGEVIAAQCLERVVIGSDTPTGTGVMPLGVIKTVTEIASLTELSGPQVWAMATGNSARVWGLNSGRIEVGAAADFVVIDAPLGGLGGSAREALERGDIPGVGAVITSGVVRTLKSRNTPAARTIPSSEPPLLQGQEGFVVSAAQ